MSRSKLWAMQTTLTGLYDIITLSETHLHNGVTSDVFKLNGFHDIIRKDRANQGGGVAIYVKECISYKQLAKYENQSLEAIWLQVNTIEGKVLICCCYRPPQDNTFWDEKRLVLDDVKTDNVKYIYILGDINADVNTANGRKLNLLCANYNLKCLITEPTRITDTSATILDQIITNASNCVNKVEVHPPVSTNDHCTVSALLNFKVHKEEAYTRHVWQYKEADFNQYRNALQETDFNACFESNNIDVVCQSWSQTLLDCARANVPNKTVTIRPNDTPWYNNALRLMKRRMLRLFHKFKRKRQVTDWEQYRQARNNYQHELDLAEQKHKEYLSQSLATSKNTKTWWQTVKWLLGKGGDTSYPPLQINDSVVMDNKAKAKEFNEFYLSHSNIDTSQAKLPDDNNFPEYMDKLEATEEEVADQLKALDTSKATGPDGISPKLLYEAGAGIVPSLTRLINLSLVSGKVPSSWKEANVIPLHKKGDKSSLNNYRPVSLLSCVSKILERIVFKHVYNHIHDRNLLSSDQSGFKPGDSTCNPGL